MFTRRLLMALIVAAAFGMQSVNFIRAADGPPVVISELMWMGSPQSSSDEWIELRNMTDAVVDVGGWRLTRLSSGNEAAMVTIPAGKTIAARGLFLISNFAVDSASTSLSVAPDLVDPAVSLLNTGLQIKLYDAPGNVIDVADDGTGTPLAGTYESGKAYASMARNGVPGDGTKQGTWHASSVAIGFKQGTIPLGTPGSSNDNVPPLVSTIPDQSAVAGTPLPFDASDATDPDGNALTFAWDFGDGAKDETAAPVHVYATAGSFRGSLSVSDGIAATSITFMVTVAAAAAPVPISSTTAVAPVGGVAFLSELLPDPDASQVEFIELYAPDADVDVSEWTLGDKGGTVYSVPKGTVIARGTYLVIDRSKSKIALNNDGDGVTLKHPDGTVADEVAYGASEKGSSYAKEGSAWMWTVVPTPGAANSIKKLNHAPKAAFSCVGVKRVNEKVDCTAADSEDPDGDELAYDWEFGDGSAGTRKTTTHAYRKDGSFVVRLTVRDPAGSSDVEEHALTIKPALSTASTKKSNSAAAKAKVEGIAVVTTIAETKDAASGTSVELKGWVSSVPGALGQHAFYFTDGMTGISVRSTITPPKLNIGDAVKVRGDRRTQSGEAYVRVTEKDGIVATGTPREIVPERMQASVIDGDTVGMLVTVTGDITALSGGRFTLDDGSGEVTVYIKSTTGFKKPAVHVGDTLTVTGIVSMTSGGIRLLPRIIEDVRIEVPAVAPVKDVVLVASARKPTWWMYALVAGGVLIGAGFGIWRKQKTAVV